MCGICGIINLDSKLIHKEKLMLMMSEMKHRGPDDEGVFIKKNIGFGFVRLSILDLSLAGHQPMYSHNGRYVIVFNGEVYNYIELKEELKTKHHFRTGTDTEVILAAYQEWGVKCLDRFNGMFAFAIMDTQYNEIFGARDRYGIKPLFYYKDKNQIILASEIKSILPLVNTEPNDRTIYDYLLYNRTDHNNDTFFKQIRKIPPGCWFKITENEFEIRKWYNISTRVSHNKILTPPQYREIFKDSLRLRLRADVPIGVSLSGGIDSSSIVSSLISDFNLKELNTFSAVYKKYEPSDESDFIEEFRGIVSNMYYTYPDENTFINDIESFILAHNEPVSDVGPYIQYKVMELASNHVTVTLDGQGADEQLAGYHYFFGSYYRELLREYKFKTFIKENIKYFAKHNSFSAIKHLIYYVIPNSSQQRINSQAYPSIKKSFLMQNISNYEINDNLYNPKSLNESLIQHFEHKLQHLLRWEDLNSMHFSIESRVPFLDFRLVESTLSTPSNQKIYHGETKHILREALKDILPEKIAQRKDKKGFSSPREQWFRSDSFKTFILKILSSESFNDRGYFDGKIAYERYQKHLQGKINISKEIWKWINTEVWLNNFFK